jgi:heme/copper-type cytochrome/quinol oxidase subunit 4
MEPKGNPTATATMLDWRIGWRIPTLMASCYVLGMYKALFYKFVHASNICSTALLLATLHLVVFLYLNGKAAEGPNRVAPQSYVTTASTVQANAFAYSLTASLATTFAQYLWYKLRVSTLKVSTIESLFCMRSNPIILFKPSVLLSAPILFCLVLLIWSINLVTSFTVGSLTIEPSNYTSTVKGIVPTFNASFVSMRYL